VPGQGNPRAVEYRPIGTQLDVVATSLGEDRVRLAVKAGVSEADNANSIQFNGAKLPAIRTRQFCTTVDSTLGKSCALVGATENRTERVKTALGVRDEINEICLMLVVTAENADMAKTAQRANTGSAPK
jgi:Flp pilus assembly secretin CpaC